MMKDMPPADPDDQLFLLLQSMGYYPYISLHEYHLYKRALRERMALSSTPSGDNHNT